MNDQKIKTIYERKKIFKFLLMLFVTFNLFLSIDFSFAQYQNEIINIRAGKHSKFYRIVLETSQRLEKGTFFLMFLFLTHLEIMK